KLGASNVKIIQLLGSGQKVRVSPTSRPLPPRFALPHYSLVEPGEL
ncbi:Uncharacterized protein TCM_011283 isoform 2, partial [Theobroma cacao]